jgi:hypothetical protein
MPVREQWGGDDRKVRIWAKHGVLLMLTVSAGAAMAQATPAPPPATAPVATPAPAPTSTPVAAVPNGAPTDIKCGLLVDTPDGKGEFQELADLHPMTQTGPGKTFYVDAPLDAGVMCGRASVLPMPYDIQVAMTGHAFYIIEKPSNRVGVLEMIDGLCQFRMLTGDLTEAEKSLLEPRLEEMQRIAAAAAG